jgi:hypothetical protein
MDFTAAGEERWGGCRCRPDSEATTCMPPLPSSTTRIVVDTNDTLHHHKRGAKRRLCVCGGGGKGGGGATWPPRPPPAPRRSSAALPHRRARVAPPCSVIAPSESFSRQGGSRGAVESTWPPSSPPAPRCPHADHPLHHLTYEPGQHRLALQQHCMSQTYMHLVAPTPDPTMALMHPRSTILDLSWNSLSPTATSLRQNFGLDRLERELRGRGVFVGHLYLCSTVAVVRHLPELCNVKGGTAPPPPS